MLPRRRLDSFKELIAVIIHKLLYNESHKKIEIQYLFALFRRQFQDYTEIHGFLSQDV